MIFFLIFSAEHLSGQNKEEAFLNFSSDKKISNATISWMTQDSRGFLWLATESGLFRYDGYEFKHYRSNPNNKGSLPGNLLLSVLADRNGNLWAGSQNGLILYDRDFDNFHTFYPDPDGGIWSKGNSVQRICQDSKGRLWVGTLKGLYTFNSKTKTFKIFNPVLSPSDTSEISIRALFVDKNDNIWSGTENGLIKYDQIKQKTTFFTHDPANPGSLSSKRVRSIFQDSNGSIWVGTENGLNRLKEGHQKFETFRHHKSGNSISSDTVLSIAEDKSKKLWIGTLHGLNTYDLNTGEFRSFFYDPKSFAGTAAKSVTSLYVDKTGAKWVGTNRGLNKAETLKKKFQLYFYHNDAFKLSSKPLSALLEGKNDSFWIGTRNYLVLFDRKKNTYTYHDCREGKRKVSVYCIAEHQEETLWLGTDEGLLSFDIKTQKIKSYPELADLDIWDIYPAKGNILWLGTINGLYKLDITTEKLSPVFEKKGDKITDYSVGTILEDDSGVLWAGTAGGGLKKINKETGEFISYFPPKGNLADSAPNTITVLQEDGNNNLWTGTYGGLYLFDKTKESFTLLPETRHQEICGIAVDKNDNTWVNTTEGILKYNLKTKTKRYYDLNDGLQTEYNTGNYIQTEKGEIFFSGPDGITAFHPDSIVDNLHTSKVVITGFSVFNKEVLPGGDLLKKSISETKHINLQNDQSVFSFEFTALNLVNPEKNQYAYMLEGFEKEWNYSGNRRFASYSHVPPGKIYTFKVKASNNDGIWNEQETSLTIYIEPPFWETAWFRFLSILLFVSALFGFYNLRIRFYKKQRAALGKQVQERTAEINKQKERIEEQAREIERVNRLLQKDNTELTNNVKDLSKARIMRRQVTFDEFRKIYPDDEACLQFLADLKWNKEYKCRKCENENYSSGPVPFSRRCSRCSSIERATTGTIFSGIKIPIVKAFYMLFLLSQGKKLTVDELSDILSHPRQTCWVYRKKLMAVINAGKKTKKNSDGWSHLVLQEDYRQVQVQE